MREEDRESKKSMMQAAYASTFGIALVLGIFGGILIGAWLDRKLGTGNKFAIVFLLVGVFADSGASTCGSRTHSRTATKNRSSGG